MSEQRDDLDEQVDRQWARFRAELADRVAGLDDDDTVRIDVLTGVPQHELFGDGPFVELVALDAGLLRAEVAGNGSLDARYALDGDAVARLLEQGWEEPAAQGEELNFSFECELRDADRVAAMAVVALREVFGCPHPSFLTGDVPTQVVRPGPPQPERVADDVDEELVVFPRDADHLQDLVDAALEPIVGEPRHDDDGDIPIWCEGSVLHVRVAAGRPAVELSCHLVVAVEHRERLATELDILNRSHPVASFFTEGAGVTMRHTLPAIPFVAQQLRMFVSRMMDEVDQVAQDLIDRVGGRRPAEDTVDLLDDEVDPDDDVPAGLLALVEMLPAGPVPAAEVALLFDEDRHELVLLLVALRTGQVTCTAIDDLDVVLDHLRAALRFVVERLARAAARAEALAVGERRSTRPRSHQLSLLPEVEPDQGSLDAGRWDQEVS